MKVKCLLVDDEPLAIELLETHLGHFDNFEVVATCSNAVEALSILSNNAIDLLFLDIQMPQLSGIDFLKMIKKPPQTIFTTAYREFALESYDLEIVDYLLKPITFDRFFKAIERYLRQNYKPVNIAATAPEIPFIILKSGVKNYKINVADIIYIESIRDYIKVSTTENELTIKYKISSIEIELQNHRFLRVHRSFIVNTEKITSFSPSIVELGKKEIPIGPLYKQSVDAALR
ncbi:LytR/AlgR family response regulator transcription factor [Pedobacter cryoconitis]|uniref:DNA-binding LytR/AlgR family response regulator n=1 Tax=Pedobacter cryoconitis TaxID=188932 RepID=A0A7X0MK26_9SPHI|nr:LytTR family DNA-binding domain-containing protein [Pedobacter cryoconitis]MBB6501754.1 DNA-binding LytR/AlgR family response regulator [Pedobacter cryoconitis]